ncbi:MAG TPA: hypothetical protein PLJ11_07785 [Methanomassiliicoccales archaeon]|nr:hypothetical protein [Methanomassiliicoccales archaeon]
MRTVAVYRPGRQFPSVSVTGARCALMCEHCQGRFLRGMAEAGSPPALLSFAARLEREGGTGLLLSGGCDAQGRVPVRPFLPAIREIKATTRLLVNVHPGLVSPQEGRLLADSGADRIALDLVLDPTAIAAQLHLARSPQDYIDSLDALCRAAPGRVAPHILLGLGEEGRELEAVRTAGRRGVACVVLLMLIGRKVDDWEARLLRAVREGADGPPVLLGCMRPRGRPDVEIAALEAGAAGIANPSKGTVQVITGKGWALEERPVCCALHR